MKPVVAPWQRITHGLRIVCRSGLVVRLVDYPHDVVMGGEIYKSDAGYQFTGVESGSALSPGAIDFSSMVGLSEHLTIPKIQAGLFDNAQMFIFAFDWAAPVEDHEEIFLGTFGKVTLQDKRYVAEVMNLVDLLNTTTGESYAAMCSLRFGGQEFGGCKVDVESLRQVTAITSVTSNAIFAATGLTGADDWFGWGEAWFTTGDNVGVPRQRVESHVEAGGVITMAEPFPFPPAIGDMLAIEPGCRKDLASCRDKWDNTARRRAFDWIPGERFMNQVGGE